jgi:anaerobic ribonucleoside-triphosphate reductase activating protein
MRQVAIDVLFQEIPNEICVGFFISGCPLACAGCHSRVLQDPEAGDLLSLEAFEGWLRRYQGLASCVLFMGGEWVAELPEYLALAKRLSYKVALYTGEERLAPALEQMLDYLKTGPYVARLGGLNQKTTNQRLIHVPTRTDLTPLFWD